MADLRETIASLGEPAYADDAVAIFHRDCLEGMSRIPEGVIDATITSPPYNIGKEYERRLSLQDYVTWSGQWMGAVHRLTRPTGALWVNLGYVGIPGQGKAVPLPYLLWNASPFFLQQEVVWTYGAGVAARASFSPRNEKFLWFLKNEKDFTFNLDAVRDPNVKYPNQKKNGKLKCNPLGKNPGDVWAIPKVTSGAGRSSAERMPHPAQFPEAVIERIILACTNPGDVILEPFLGSGTAAAVAKRLGRTCIGFEVRQDYVATAIARVART